MEDYYFKILCDSVDYLKTIALDSKSDEIQDFAYRKALEIKNRMTIFPGMEYEDGINDVGTI